MRTNSRRIGLCLLSGSTYAAEAKVGIYRYARATEDWDVVDFDGRSISAAIEAIVAWRAHALIVCLTSDGATHVEALQTLRLPIVNLTNQIPASRFVNVHPCANSVAALAHEHFASIARKNFGYFGVRNSFELHALEAALGARLADHGLSLSSYRAELRFAEAISHQPELPSSLIDWLNELPKPASILCDSDQSAIYLAGACQQVHLAIPLDVAILGVANDQRARLSDPTLSSVVCPAERIGYQAACVVDQWLAGQWESHHPVVVPATEVIARASTRPKMLDPGLALAIEYIHEHAGRGISVSDVMTTQQVSRVTFERRFKLVTGRAPGAEIRRLRLARIQELLRCTRLTTAEIATECGFESVASLSIFFKKATGTSVIAFRNEQADATEAG